MHYLYLYPTLDNFKGKRRGGGFWGRRARRRLLINYRRVDSQLAGCGELPEIESQGN